MIISFINDLDVTKLQTGVAVNSEKQDVSWKSPVLVKCLLCESERCCENTERFKCGSI